MNTSEVKTIYDSTDRTAYESERWASSPVAKSGHTLTKEAILRSVIPRLSNVKEYLELGAGPGTWTRVLAPSLAGANLHLVDISRSMLDAAQKNLADIANVTYTESDFLAFVPSKTYDVFFSSRAVEYFPDKAPVMSTVARSLKPGGKAFLITKMPHYRRMKFLGKDAGAFHQHQSAPETFITAATSSGMRLIDLRPVFVVMPGLRSPLLNLFFTRVLRLLPWNPLTAAITESYLMVFEKV